MDEAFKEAEKLMSWNRFLLRPLGLWPISPSELLYNTCIIYYVYHLLLNYIALYRLIGRFLVFCTVLIETLTYTDIFLKAFTIHRYNRKIGILFEKMKIDFTRSRYASEEEAKEFLKYNTIAKSLIKVLIFFPNLANLLYFIRPILLRYLIARPHKNVTLPYRLPFTHYKFYQITKVETYALNYASVFPLVILNFLIQAGTDCMVISMGCHFCGKLAALSQRIRKVDVYDHYTKEIKVVIGMYQQLLRIGTMIKATFSNLMLYHLCLASITICVTLFRSLFVEETFSLVSVFVLLSLKILRLYFHCWVGEYMLHESNGVNAAFYDCNWLDMTNSDRKLIVLTLLRSQHPVGFVAGGFGTFSIFTFADIMKTAMAYLSFLRNFY